MRKTPKNRGKPAAPLFSGTVTTPATPNKPTGYLWDKLEATSSKKDLEKMLEGALAIGYAETGQFVTAVRARLVEIGDR